MIDLYYWPTPNGFKISIALEELGLSYQVKPVNIGKGEQFEPSFLKIAPNNRMPAIVDHDGPDNKAISIFESGAILLYLAEKTGKLMPASKAEKIEVTEWLMWQMGGFGPMLGQAHHFIKYTKEPVPYGIERYGNEANRLYGVLNKRLEGREFVVGDSLSIADIAILPWTRTYYDQHVDIEDYPHVKEWRARLFLRPAFQAGIKLGAEWREDLSKLTGAEWDKMFGMDTDKAGEHPTKSD
ncbi:MAG: glutathione binding-like protein [Candidatus Puniceispirillaceae bacterium]